MDGSEDRGGQIRANMGDRWMGASTEVDGSDGRGWMNGSEGRGWMRTKTGDRWGRGQWMDRS